MESDFAITENQAVEFITILSYAQTLPFDGMILLHKWLARNGGKEYRITKFTRFEKRMKISEDFTAAFEDWRLSQPIETIERIQKRLLEIAETLDNFITKINEILIEQENVK